MGRAARPPELQLLDQIDDHERRVRKLERRRPKSLVTWGARTDLPAGVGPRTQQGLLADGVSIGFEIWSNAGVHTVIASTPA